MTLYFSGCNDSIILFNNIHRVSIHIYLLSAHYYIIETTQKSDDFIRVEEIKNSLFHNKRLLSKTVMT